MATDQEIRDAGFLYIPKQKYLQDPYKLSTPPPDTTPDTSVVQQSGYQGGGNFSPYNPDPNSIVNRKYNPYPYRNAAENSYLKGGSNSTVPKYLNQSYDPSGKIANAQTMYNKASLYN